MAGQLLGLRAEAKLGAEESLDGAPSSYSLIFLSEAEGRPDSEHESVDGLI